MLRPGEATGLTWPQVHLDTDPATALTRIAQTAGIGRVHAQQLRHATASLLSDAGDLWTPLRQ